MIFSIRVLKILIFDASVPAGSLRVALNALVRTGRTRFVTELLLVIYNRDRAELNMLCDKRFSFIQPLAPQTAKFHHPQIPAVSEAPNPSQPTYLLGSCQAHTAACSLALVGFFLNKGSKGVFFTCAQPCHACMYVYTSHIVFLSDLPLKRSSDSPEPEDVLWEQINPDLDAFRSIISNHFGSPCESHELLQPSAYARTFLYILQDGLHVVGRVILPARRTLKTEADVAAMDSIRGTSTLPWCSRLF